MSGDLFPESVRLVSAERGDQYDEVVLNFSGYLPDDFKIAVAIVAPAENGAECCPGEFRDAVVEAMKRTCERIAALEAELAGAREEAYAVDTLDGTVLCYKDMVAVLQRDLADAERRAKTANRQLDDTERCYASMKKERDTALAELEEARAHVRNHHKEACETCAAIEGERDAARERNAALEAILGEHSPDCAMLDRNAESIRKPCDCYVHLQERIHVLRSDLASANDECRNFAQELGEKMEALAAERAQVQRLRKGCEDGSECERMIAELQQAQAALRGLLTASDSLRTVHLHMLVHGPDSILNEFDWAREKAKQALGGA